MNFKAGNSLHLVAALFTWLVVFGISTLMIRNAESSYAHRMVEFVLVQITFISLFMSAARDHDAYGVRWQGFVKLFGSLAAIMYLGANFPIDFLQIYSIMWVTLLPYYFGVRVSSVILVLTMTAWFFIQYFMWDVKDAFLGALLYGTFHVFALLSALATQRAEAVSLHAQELNRDLLATQQLLTEAAKENERTRIARDLHDQFGHHMTALTVNLQVASRMAEGDVKNKVDICHELSRQLLADVRKAVSVLREHNAIDIGSSLRLIIDRVPNLNVHLDIEEELVINNVAVAEAVLRCVQESITNTLRHTRANDSWVRLWRDNSTLCIEVTDNGTTSSLFAPGNGLTGMRERIEKLGGQLIIDAINSLKINVRLPHAVTA